MFRLPGIIAGFLTYRHVGQLSNTAPAGFFRMDGRQDGALGSSLLALVLVFVLHC